MSVLRHSLSYWTAGGPLLLPLALVCFCILALVTRTLTTTRVLLKEGSGVLDWLRHCEASQSASALRAVLPANRFSAVFTVALGHISAGHAFPLEVMLAQEHAALASLRRDTILLTALTAAAPLLGLLGTVGGMIATFDAVALVTGQTGTRVAGGISQALITTQYGLVVAMPGVFGLAHIRQRTRDVQLLLGDCRAHIVAIISARPTGTSQGVLA